MFHFTSKIRRYRAHNEGSKRQNKPSQITESQKVLFTDITVLSLLPTGFVDPAEKVHFRALQ